MRHCRKCFIDEKGREKTATVSNHKHEHVDIFTWLKIFPRQKKHHKTENGVPRKCMTRML